MLAVAGILLVEAAGLGPWWSAPFRVRYQTWTFHSICNTTEGKGGTLRAAGLLFKSPAAVTSHACARMTSFRHWRTQLHKSPSIFSINTVKGDRMAPVFQYVECTLMIYFLCCAG